MDYISKSDFSTVGGGAKPQNDVNFEFENFNSQS